MIDTMELKKHFTVMSPDKDGDFEIEIDGAYDTVNEYLTPDEARSLVDFLNKYLEATNDKPT